MKRAILVVDHGSRRPEANEQLLEVARLVEAQGGPDLVVRHAHMELAPPTIAEGFEACVEAGATFVVVHPYMLSPGRHAMEDIPRHVAEAAARFPHVRYVVSAPLGVHPALAEVVLARCEGLLPRG
ncbi:MAG: CbiX/SirB N-terminal domain-containing protein [Polyangiales bacterium]